MSQTTLRWEDAQAYFSSLAARSCSEDTIATYRRNLKHFFSYLPPGGEIAQDTVVRWRDQLLADGYQPRTVNLRLSSVNGFLAFMNLRQYQIPHHLHDFDNNTAAALTRSDYLRLLLAAKDLGDERTYLLIKLFALTGLSVQALSVLTVEAVAQGEVALKDGQRIRLPLCLQKELNHYCQLQQCKTGPIFLNTLGKPLSRTTVTINIQNLGQSIGLSQDVSNPRALHKLWQATQDEMHDQVTKLVEQMQERLIEQEQCSIGWDISQDNSVKQ